MFSCVALLAVLGSVLISVTIREQNLVTSAFASWSDLTMCTRGSTEPGGGTQPVTRKAGGASAKIPWVSG